MRRMVSALVGIGLAIGAASAVYAESMDPVVVGPTVYKMIFENDKVRVSEISFDPGESIGMHSHPDHFVYVLAAGTIKITKSDGTFMDFIGTPGQIVWIPAESHQAVNIGTTEFRALVVELKPLPYEEHTMAEPAAP